ncbi:MAG: hypothetical protein OEO79_12860 [Gemmatimonadota bacterium]|nr:hypothetical protein [Gemmatimonadota bacterium]
MDSLLSAHRTFDRDLRRLVSGIDSSDRSQISTDSVQVLIRPLYVLHSFEPILATLDDLVQSGSSHLIRDDSLRVGLSEFRRDLEGLDLAEEYAENYWSTEMVALFREDLVVRDLAAFEARLGPSTFSTDFTALLGSREFENRGVLRWALGLDLQTSATRVSSTVDLIIGRLDLLLPDQ